jgi:DNA-binding transcriptional regulator PaaX
MKIDYAEVLEFFLYGLELATRRDCGLVLAGYRMCDSDRRAGQLLERLERQQLLQRDGRGAKARFRITAEGLRRITVLQPERLWNEPWDRRWRVFSYDLPEVQRKDRVRLWKALHTRKLGLLHRSVWVWPRPVEPVLQEILKAEGIAECFCGFEAVRVFLCTDAEVVATAWDFEEIGKRQQAYLQHQGANTRALAAARDLEQLARTVRAERLAYQSAFSLDPLLPRDLCPAAYRGFAVQEQHERFRRQLPARTAELAGR